MAKTNSTKYKLPSKRADPWLAKDGATQPPPPKEFASAGIIDDSELQSTNIKKYIRARLGDRS